MKKQKEWRPLPDSITIKDSKIEGLGVFAIQDIEANRADYDMALAQKVAGKLGIKLARQF